MAAMVLFDAVHAVTSVMGTGSISGEADAVVTVDGTPARRQVFLYERTPNTGKLIRMRWSDGEGRYRFTHLPIENRYMVVAHDHLRQHNAVAMDHIQPALMPEFE